MRRHYWPTRIGKRAGKPEQAEFAAQLWEESRRFGLSLADRACLGLAMQQNNSVLTADKVWMQLKLDIEMQLIR